MGWYQRGSGYTVQIGLTVERATATLPQTATAAIFAISGGRILLRQIVGEVTTVIGSTATTAQLSANPTAAGTSVPLCAGTGDLNAAAVGTLLTITGTVATALQLGLAVVAQAAPMILPVGTIDLIIGSSTTGSVKWMIVYSPLDAGALVAAA